MLCLQTVELQIDGSVLKCACVRGQLVVAGLHVSAAAAVAAVLSPSMSASILCLGACTLAATATASLHHPGICCRQSPRIAIVLN